MEKLIRWLRKFYNLSLHTIGFFPALIALLILAVTIVIYNFEDSTAISSLKQKFLWMNLKNSEAARAILTTVATGIIGLTVFSFSMVMLVLSQAVSQISNRLLDNFIGNKYQKITLGFYLGTILTSFFLLTVVDDKGTSQVPSLSVLFVVLLTIIDLFLFVHFLHYITQSVRYEKLIKTIHRKTIHSLETFYAGEEEVPWNPNSKESMDVQSPLSGYFQGINRNQLLRVARENNWYLEFYPLRCTFVIKGEPILKLYCSHRPDDQKLKLLFECLDFYTGQEIDKNPFYGFLHLSEIAIKALSPGINDPNTAVLCVHSLTDLLACKLHTPAIEVFADSEKTGRVYIRDRPLEEIFEMCVSPIWDYGKNDRFIQKAMGQMLRQLRQCDQEKNISRMLDHFEEELGK
ncbi:MAG TPA: DUF2254 domain-containing protein [Flavisolibacter sp.]|jgi:uncharacterized membrane protein|nr:DUF2254 domain-containing protein [Flavisolibacter sp.]